MENLIQFNIKCIHIISWFLSSYLKLIVFLCESLLTLLRLVIYSDTPSVFITLFLQIAWLSYKMFTFEDFSIQCCFSLTSIWFFLCSEKINYSLMHYTTFKRYQSDKKMTHLILFYCSIVWRN